MLKITLQPTAVIFLALLFGMLAVQAYETPYLEAFTNKYVFTRNTRLTSTANRCLICHKGSDPNIGGVSAQRNDYGIAFSNSVHKAGIAMYFAVTNSIRALGDIQNLDSDNDCFTNIVEINALTFPGDPTDRPPDTTAPNVGISSPASGTAYTSAQTVTLTAAATDCLGVTRVEFYDGATLMGQDTSSPFTFNWTVANTNNGMHPWRARAYDAAGNVATSMVANLTVSIAPSITAQPTNKTVFAGGVAAFAVSANGAPLTYQWQFNATAIPGATGSGYSLTAHTTNAGNYRVVVSNAGGSATSSVAMLTVNLPSAARLRDLSKAPGGAFSLNLTGTVNAYYEIQSSTNLNNTNAWATIAFITNSGGKTTFTDTSANGAPKKYYRSVAR